MRPPNARLCKFGDLGAWEWHEEGVRCLELTGEGVLEDYEADNLGGSFIDVGHYCVVLEEDCDVYRPSLGDALSMFSEGDREDRLLASFRKGVIPKDLCELAKVKLRAAATKGDNRGLAGGKLDPSKVRSTARGKLVMLGGSGTRARYMLEDGTVSKVDIANFTASGIAGYFNAEERHPFCRQTVYTKDNPGRTEDALPFLEAVSERFKAQAPNSWAAQKGFLDSNGLIENGWVMGDTVFTTITVNRNWRTACHKDAGDYPQGFGNLVVLEGGAYKGGYTGFPKYRVAVDVREGDFLAMDVHQWHCNTEIEAVGSEYERISVVSYAREKMRVCGPKEEEGEKYREWLAKFLPPKKKAALNLLKHETLEAKKEAEVAYLKELFGGGD